jgi:hypothetical protein
VRRLALVVPLVAALAACGGENETTVARVGKTKVTAAQLEHVIEQSRERILESGQKPPKAGSPAYATLRKQALGLVVYRAELAEQARRLGVRVDEDEIERRIGQSASEEEDKDAEAGIEDAVRAQVIYEQLFDRVTGNAAVNENEIARYYREHPAFFAKPPKPLTAVRSSIRAQLLAAKRNDAMKRFLARMQSDLGAQIEYAKDNGTERD